MKKFENQHFVLLCSLLLSLISSTISAQEQSPIEDPAPVMSEDPQVLPPATDSATESAPEVLPAPQTEAIPTPSPVETSTTTTDNAVIDTLTDNTSTLEPINEPAPEAKSELQKKTGVVSEEELLKTKTKKAPRVKSIKPTQSEMYIQQKIVIKFLIILKI